MKQLYWAYGSNLNVRQMRERCPAAEVVGPLTVPNAVLRFRGVADVAYLAGARCPGGLWRVSESDVRALDAYEGVNLEQPWLGLYERKWLTLRIGARVERCLYYQMTTTGIMPPWQAYLDAIAQGYRDFGLDLSRLERALQHSWDQKRRTPKLRERHKRKGMPGLARGVS